jgi:hypothetical protein
MIIADTNPSPNPAIRRPATRRASAVEATWRTTLTIKTPHPKIMVVRRPNLDATLLKISKGYLEQEELPLQEESLLL